MRRERERGGTLFVITGPSGSGKTTLARALLKDKALARTVKRSISFTTRPKRPNEKQARDYFFLSGKEFERERAAKKVLEWTRYLGYYYGTKKEFVDEQLQASRSLLLCIDTKGARRIRSLYPHNSVLIFVLPPSIKELERRIVSRCPGTCSEEVRRRVGRAEKEIAEADRFDYRIVNRDFSRALMQLKKIILKHGTQRRSNGKATR
jgi:guanylate kinase